MNPIAFTSVDALSEPRGESPAPGVTGDADSAEFGLALAMAAAAQSPAAVVPRPSPAAVPVPTGDRPDPALADATRAIADDVADALAAVPRPAPPGSAPLPLDAAGTARPPIAPFPARAAGAGREGTPLPASPAGPEAKLPLPLPMTVAAGAELEGAPLASAPVRPEPASSPAIPAGNAAASTTPVAAEAAAVARDASLRTADLPLTIRVLELVRGMTEQAARVALDTAMSTGPAQGSPLETAPQSGRLAGAPRQDLEAPLAAAVVSRQALATKALEALPGPDLLERGRPASRAPLRPASEAVAQNEAATSGEVWMARSAMLPRAAAPAGPPLPVLRGDVRLAPGVPTQAVPLPGVEAGERGRGRPVEPAPDGDGPTRAAGAMLADVSAAARASLAGEPVPAFAGPDSSVPQNARPAAGSVDPAAGSMRAAPAEPHTPARLGDQVTLQFSGEDGLEGQLRVAVRGQNVRATILSDDPVSAERFARGLDGLQRALLDRGFSEARLNVQQTPRSEGPASGYVPRDGNQGESQPRGESRDRYPSSRQEREPASPEDRPDRRPSRQRTER